MGVLPAPLHGGTPWGAVSALWGGPALRQTRQVAHQPGASL